MNKQIFALDIGTRTVTGILLDKDATDCSIAGCHTEEHRERAMLDGQIQDVLQVADIIRTVKSALENGDGTLEKVYAAAAGRSLKTKRGSASIPLQSALTGPDMVTDLEFSAVYNAQQILAEEDGSQDGANYYCVGYSIVKYRLDGERIGSLIDQSGNVAEAEVIATFLPKVVVESLLAALERADLQLAALTLEPIAAIRVLVPESMRRLNVALVDIGAGTSDIAITEDGTVSAYGMVPLAGDEITEKISDAYLLDYPLAEAMKRSISKDGKAVVHDILGFETTIELEEFMEVIRPAAEELAEAITTEILTLNGEAPRAVMVIGGGSLTPGLPQLIAKKLSLPENRVAVRSTSAIQSLKDPGTLPDGPDFVTPVGIAIAADEKPVHYITVHVNERPVRMFEMRELTVGDCLVQAGIELGKYYGKPGDGSVITLNGETKTVAGSLGSGPRIFLNGEAAVSAAFIKDGDAITIRHGQSGEDAEPSVQDLIGDAPPVNLIINGEPMKLDADISINGKPAAPDDFIRDGDAVVMTAIRTVGDLQKILPDSISASDPFITLYVNGKTVRLASGNSTGVLINGRSAGPDDLLQDGDRIEFTEANGSFGVDGPIVADAFAALELEPWQTLDIFFDGKRIELKEKKVTASRDEEVLDLSDPIADGDDLELIEHEDHAFIFQDVFRHIDIDLTKATGRFELLINDEKASFDSPVHIGDRLAIAWSGTE